MTSDTNTAEAAATAETSSQESTETAKDEVLAGSKASAIKISTDKDVVKGTKIEVEDLSGNPVNFVITKAASKTAAGTVTYGIDSVADGVKSITVPNTVVINGGKYKVTKVAPGLLKNNKTVTSVRLGANVKIIGKEAFKNCSKLSTVVVGKNVTKIGVNSFSGISDSALIKVKAVDKTSYNALVKALKTAGAKEASYKYIKTT